MPALGSNEPTRWTVRVGHLLAPLLLLLGAGIFLQALLGPGISLRWVGWLFLAAAVVEGISGILVNRNERSGAAFIVGGALTVFFGVYVVTRLSERPHAIAMLLAIFLVMNGIFRGLELAIERPRSWPTELLYVATAFILAGVLLADWRFASARMVAACVGVEIVARGVALWGGAAAARRYGDRPVWSNREPLVWP